MNIKYKYYYNCKYFHQEKILSNKKKSYNLSFFSKIRTDTELKFSVCTNISTNYPKIYHTLL